MNDVNDNDIKNTDDLILKIQKAQPSFLDCKCSENQFLKKYHFILTENAKERLNKLYTYIKKKIPVIIEGETGSSKSLSAEIICDIISHEKAEEEKEEKIEDDNYNIYNKESLNNINKQPYIKYNLSAEVKISDLMKKLTGDKTYLSGIKIIEGEFFRAFKGGIPLILDEINLASQEVLQCIEDALDSQEINIEVPSIGHVEQKMTKGFCLIATQNPNKDNYANKRQYLSQSFLSHFQILKFPSFEFDELKKIAEELFKSFNNGHSGNEKDKQFITDLLDFHNKWTSQLEVKNDIICFTIREIKACIRSYIEEQKKNGFKIVKVIYGSRYEKEEKNKLLDLLEKYDSFKLDCKNYRSNKIEFKIPKNIKGIYESQSILELFESSIFSLKHRRHILIVGKEGSGKSMAARCITKIYNKNEYFHFICTEETKVSDLIGYHSPSTNKSDESEAIENNLEWKEGFLTKAIKNGKIVILDNLHEANSIITERLNDLLDSRDSFYIPENPLENNIKINEKFRVIGISDRNLISKMSPAFLNRFDIINLENQLDYINEDEFNNLIQILLENEQENNRTIYEENAKDIIEEMSFFDEDESSMNKSKELDMSKESDKNISTSINNIKNIIQLKKEEIKKLGGKLINLIKDNSPKKLINNEKMNEDEDEKIYNIKDISRFCFCLKIILNIKEFKDKIETNDINIDNIIDFIYELLFTENDKISNGKIKEILLKMFKGKNKNQNNSFIYEGNNSLENFIAIVYASYLIHLHLCVIGPSGVGKTACAKFISEILKNNNDYKLFPFHRNTKPSELYGTINIKKGKIEEYNGPFIDSALNGNIFIADEMNLSSKSTMNCLVPILDPLLDKNIYIPSVDKVINIKENFFFIACQNDMDNLGRNIIPNNLRRKIKGIKYPNQKDEEIIKICVEKRNEKFGKSGVKESIKNFFTKEHAEYLGKFMIKYNDKIADFNSYLLKWSFRDIDKLMNRIYEHNNEKFKNFKYYHFIYFYLFSSFPKNENFKEYKRKKINIKKKNIYNLKEIINSFFFDCFKINTKDSEELEKDYFSKPIIDLESSYLMKGSIGVKINDLKDKIKKGKQINFNNYYDDFFKLKLISRNEPIILMGPSSYKTNLAKFFIKSEFCKRHHLSKKYKMIYLNQKTTIEELLGEPRFLSQKESRVFNYNLLCDILYYNENNSKKEIFELEKEKKLIKENLDLYNEPIIKDILQNIYNNMINDKIDDKKPKIEYNPGSILLSILKQESLIFENMHQVSTEVFERFNELFGTETTLTLNEDIYGTFFNDEKDKAINLKKLDNFLILGICPENSINNLSESILSRFSLIYVGEHSKEEKEKIIKSKYKSLLNSKIADKYLNNILSQFESGYLKDIKKIKLLFNVFSKMNNNNNKNDDNIENNYNYILSYIQLNNDSSDINSIYEGGKNILYYENNNIFSNASRLCIPILKEPRKSIKQFTPLFNLLIDLIHFGICTCTPLIFEGNPGQGKQAAIEYVCKDLLDYEVENIIITKSFNLKDLFSKTIIEPKKNDKNFEPMEMVTKLYEKLYNENKNSSIKAKKIMFVFHNINNAESDVLSKISEIFSKNYKDYDKYALIGLINLNEGLIDKETYYSKFFPKSIYYRINSLNITNIKEIINQEPYAKYYEKNRDILFTLNDISKFEKLKKICRDESFLNDIIFSNKSLFYNLDSDNNQLINNNINNNLHTCDFEFFNNSGKFNFNINNQEFSLDAENPIERIEFEKAKNTLSFEQKKCFAFLGLSVKSKIPCIIQGSTGVGKSHLIKLFAKILGKKLHIFELNKDNQISLLTKCYIFNDYDQNEINDINHMLDGIQLQKEDMPFDKRYAEIVKKELNNKQISILKELKEKYNLFNNRFKSKESDFLEAVKKGEWVLLDGIENAPSFIAEKIVSLCGDNPEINIYEKDLAPINPGEGFHLFITYNQQRTNNNNFLPKSLLDKCLLFNLKSFLDDATNISQIIYGYLINLMMDLKNINIIYDIASRLSHIHKCLIKKINNEYNESISERTLINYCKTLKKDCLPLSIIENLLYFYFPSVSKETKEEIINLINFEIMKPGVKYDSSATNYIYECKDSLNILNSLTNEVDSQKFQKFLGAFLSSLLNIKFKYINAFIESIKQHIEVKKLNNDNASYLNKFISFLENISSELMNQNDINVNDYKLREKFNFINIKKLLLFEELNKENFFSWNWINISRINNDIFVIFQNLYEKKNLQSLKEFIKELSNNINSIPEIIKIFPYSQINDSKIFLINSLLKCIIEKAYLNKINFKIRINNGDLYDFKFIEKDNDIFKLVLDLNINKNNKLIITQNTEINNKKNKALINKFNENQINNIYFRFIEQVFSSKQIKKKYMETFMKNALLMADDKIKLNSKKYGLKLFFKSDNNMITNCWSILFLNNNKLNSFILSNKNINMEFELFFAIEKTFKQLIAKQNEEFSCSKKKIINITSLLYRISDKTKYLYNLLDDKNYIVDMNLNSTEEYNFIIKKISEEILLINEILKLIEYNKEIFIKYNKLLENELSRLKDKQDKLKIENYQKSLIKKLEDSLKDDVIFQNIKFEINKTNTFEDLQKFNDLINNYLIRYKEKDINNKLNLFLRDKDIVLDDINNNNTKLIDLLLKYSEIKDLCDEIVNNQNKKLISLQKLFSLIERDYADIFMNLFLDYIKNNKSQMEKEKKIILSLIYSMLAQEIIDKGLEDNFINLTNLINNSYDILNYGKMDYNWCWNIQKKYDFDSKIYIPELNNLSFLFLFIRYKDLNNFEKTQGILIESDDLFMEFKINFNELENLDLNKMVLKIGNIILSYFKSKTSKDLDSLSNIVKETINCNSNSQTILEKFLKYKKLFLETKYEKLKFNELEKKGQRKKLFTTEYPSLINFLNYNYTIYNKLINEPTIFNFYPEESKEQFIPLWFLCLKFLGNSGNMKVSFKTMDEQTLEIEKNLREKIINSFKSNKRFNNLDWLLLILPNNIHFLEGEFSERFYQFFNNLLIDISYFNDKIRKEMFEIIKNFIFKIFEQTFKKGMEFLITKDESLFNIEKELKEKMKNILDINSKNFIKGDNFKQLNLLLKSNIDKNNKNSLYNMKSKLEKDILTFENADYQNKKIEFIRNKYQIMKENCNIYNNFYKSKRKDELNKESLINLKKRYDIDKYIKNKDASYNNSNKHIIQYINEEIYINKYINNIKINREEITFHQGEITKNDFLIELKEIINVIKDSINILVSINEKTINKGINSLRKCKNNIESKLYLFQIYIKNKKEFEEISSKTKSNLIEDVLDIKNEINNIINKINIVLEDAKLPLSNIEDQLWLNEIIKEIYIDIPKIPTFFDISYIYPGKKDEISIKEGVDENIPYFFINEQNIEGYNEIHFDLGNVNYYDSEYKNIFFISLDNKINIQVIDELNEVKLINHSNKLYSLKYAIPKKKREEIEPITKNVELNLSYNQVTKNIKYLIKFYSEALRIYIKCEEYKMKYLGNNIFLLNTSNLFAGEEINFKIKTNLYSKNYKTFFESTKNNTSSKPKKFDKNDGFSIKINSNSIDDILSFYINILIGKLFKFHIKIEANIKKFFNYDFKIKYKDMNGFVSQKIYCPIDTEDFELYILTNHNRKFTYSIYLDESPNIKDFKINNKKKEFFNFTKIDLNIKLLKKRETKINIISSVYNINKTITIIFEKTKKSENFGIQNIEELQDNSNSSYFAFDLNEFNAKGIDEEKQFTDFDNIIKEEMKIKYIGKIKDISSSKFNFELIKHPSKTILGIHEFFIQINELSLLIPIFLKSCSNINNNKNIDKQKDIIKKNYYLMYLIYSYLDNQKKNIKHYLYKNFFSKEIIEFMVFFSHLKENVNFQITEEKKTDEDKEKKIKNEEDEYDDDIINQIKQIKNKVDNELIKKDENDSKKQIDQNINQEKKVINDRNNLPKKEKEKNSEIPTLKPYSESIENNEKKVVNKKEETDNQNNIENNNNIGHIQNENINNFEDDTWKINELNNSNKENIGFYNDYSESDENMSLYENKKDINKDIDVNTKEEIKEELIRKNKKSFMKNKSFVYEIEENQDLCEFEDEDEKKKKKMSKLKEKKTTNENLVIYPESKPKEKKNFVFKKKNKFDHLIKIIDKDEKHDFEKQIHNINENENNIDNNNIHRNLLIGEKTKASIYYNPKKQRFYKKTFDNETKINDFQLPFENRDLFNEFDKKLIDNIFQKIKEGKETKDDFQIKKPKIPKHLLKDKINQEQNIVKNLIDKSKLFIYRFFFQISQTALDFSQIAFCFVIDCSLYLGNFNKFINLILVLSMIKIIHMINIKYSILLCADDNFKIELKNYDEIIDLEDIIERIYEACIIRRYKNNILKSTQIAIEYLKCENIDNRVFFIFSDSLDESILQFSNWKEKILFDKYNSFIFFVETTHKLNEEMRPFIIKMWENFEKTANKEETCSKIKLIMFEQDNFSNIDIFNDISEFLNHIHLKNNNNNKPKENIIINEKKVDLKIFNDSLNSQCFKGKNSIIFIDKPKKLVPSNIGNVNIHVEKINKKEIPFIREHISKILQISLDKTLIESIFYPNKATQKQLSTKGSEIDIMSFILYSLCPVQEPMIYLEEKGGLIRDYSITVIIDNSMTCFDEINFKHSYLTIINLLKIINCMAIPSFDLIITGEYGNPSKILLFDKPSIYIFKNDEFYYDLLKNLSNPIYNTDLKIAIETAYTIKKKKKYDKESYLFVLTDGLIHYKDKKIIREYSNQCQIIGMKVFGIGIGIYPCKSKNYLFDTFIYSTNPENLLKAISVIFGKSIKTENNFNKSISEEKEDFNKELNTLFEEFVRNDKFVYEKLRKELMNIRQGDDVLNLFCHEEVNTYDYKDIEAHNIEIGKNLEIYSPNILKTQKILIVMLWSYELNPKGESPYVEPKYINEKSEINGSCLKSAIEFFGIDDYVVMDYESAIKELLRKDKKNECIYYSVWVFCGPQYPILPPINGKENKSNPYLVEEFINVLIEFWTNGGSLIFLAEGDPLNFQVNLFLEKIDFSKNEKPKFRIYGDYLGDNVLKQDKTGKLNEFGVFDKSKKKSIINGIEVQRQSLSHNLAYIYEGYSISYAVDENTKEKLTINEKEKLNPFKPYSINTEGGISTLIYEADQKGRGDIIIDCGYTKCFLNMENTGTFRYIQNMAAWTARPEINFIVNKKNPWEWRPKGVNYKVNFNSHYNGYLKFEEINTNVEDMKILFTVDKSGSTNFELYHNEVINLINENYNEKRGDIIYIWGSEYQKLNKEEFINYVENDYDLDGTYPKLISDIINLERNNKCKHLMIITDGNVGTEDILETDKKMEKIKYYFDFVSVYIIGTEANLSISAPFCRKTPHKAYMKKTLEDKEYIEVSTLNEEEIKTLNEIEKYENYENFMNDFDKIQNAVQAKCIGVLKDSELEKKLESLFNSILDKNKITNPELFNKRKDILLGMTRGSLRKAFTLERINAAISNYIENSDDESKNNNFEEDENEINSEEDKKEINSEEDKKENNSEDLENYA